MALAPGTRLGRYRIEGPLGAGGMGEVYRAFDATLGRMVAVKVLPPAVADDPVALARFEREARAVAALSHPNVLAIYDFGNEDGVAYAVMELLEGETLGSRIARAAPGGNTAVEIALQIAAGLQAAHSRGIVHRDLKPDNIFLTSDGVVKILDFGLAHQGRTFEPGEPESPTVSWQTQAGTVLGTMGYMSPEQARGLQADARSDIFSFGCVLYELATGQRAFRGAGPADTLAAILRDEPPEANLLNPELPPALPALIHRCLEKKPDERYASVADLLPDLKKVLDPSAPVHVAAAPAEMPIAPPSEAARRRTFRFLALILLAALVLVLAATVWMRFHTPRNAIDSLAVLPFDNASKDPDAEYLGDGLTESLINQLSRVPSLKKVMARATVFRYKGTADPQEAGRKLGVGAVVTGSVSRRGDRLSISAELVEISTGARLWGEKYDRPFADLLRVQDSIATEIADRLRLRLSGEERRLLGQHGTENPEAYELFLKARSFLPRDSEEGDLEARRLYLQALEKDPKFVEAHLGVAATYARSAGNGYARPAEAWPRADEEIRKALDLDPSNVQARCGLASRRFLFDWDWAGTEREFGELSTDPRLLLGVQFHPIALFFWARGRTEEAVALVERALRVDPGNLESRIMLADFLAQAGRLEEAIGSYRSIIETEPSDPSPLFGLAEVLRRRGDVKGAIDALRRAYELSGAEDGAKALATARTEKDYENVEVAVARVRLGALEALSKERYVSPIDLARLYAQVGEREKAFASLEAALAERSSSIVSLKVERAWDRIRDDARFAALVRRVGIP